MSDEFINEKLTNVIYNCFWAESYLTILIKIEDDLNHYPNLFTTINRAITDAFIILVSKIYDKNSKGSSIVKILKDDNIFNEIDKNIFNLEVINSYKMKQRLELEGGKISILTNNLKTWRDKFYAHTDKEFLNDERSLRKQHKISIEEFYELINFAKHTSQHLYLLINNESIGSDLKLKCEKEFELLIKTLEEHKGIYNNLYKEI